MEVKARRTIIAPEMRTFSFKDGEVKESPRTGDGTGDGVVIYETVLSLLTS